MIGIIILDQITKTNNAKKFNKTPIFNISITVNFLVENTMVLGGVAAGKANAKEAETNLLLNIVIK